MPRISQAPLTSGRTGTACSSMTTATLDALAISLRMVATPPPLGVTGDDRHAGPPGGGGHGGGDALQVGDGEALLEDEATRQVERAGPRHGQVVDRAVDGQVADVAAGEEDRRHDVGVGG